MSHPVYDWDTDISNKVVKEYNNKKTRPKAAIGRRRHVGRKASTARPENHREVTEYVALLPEAAVWQ